MKGGGNLANLASSLEELRRIGVNLNQLLHAVNKGAVLSESEGKDLRKLLADVRNIVG